LAKEEGALRAGKLAVAAGVARVLPGDEDGDAEEWANRVASGWVAPEPRALRGGVRGRGPE